MNPSNPILLVAGSREAGARCPHCQVEVRQGEDVARCCDCGAVHHRLCWQTRDNRCGSFECAPARRTARDPGAPVLKITPEDVVSAVPLPSRRAFDTVAVPLILAPRVATGVSGLAVASLVVALLGIVLFGALTGLVAILLGCLALGSIQRDRRRGTGLAVAGVFLGLLDVVGWLVFLVPLLSGHGGRVSLEEFEPDLAAMESLAPHIRSAVKANVLIESETRRGLLGGKGIGSGVILRVANGSALIVTNRHVVDPDFSDQPNQTGSAAPGGRLQVKLIGQSPLPGSVVWVAPDGIDLALLIVPSVGSAAQAAQWQADRRLIVGEDVFSIGNPNHLDWSHTRGSISQLRLQTRGSRKVHVIQTDAAINPGNSGGGLYDKDGMLIGINTWTNDKRVSEGISFAIALDSLLTLDPPPLKLSERP